MIPPINPPTPEVIISSKVFVELFVLIDAGWFLENNEFVNLPVFGDLVDS